MLRAADEKRKSVLRAADVVADLEDDKVPADEHVVEIVRVDLEQDRGHSTHEIGSLSILSYQKYHLALII